MNIYEINTITKHAEKINKRKKIKRDEDYISRQEHKAFVDRNKDNYKILHFIVSFFLNAIVSPQFTEVVKNKICMTVN